MKWIGIACAAALWSALLAGGCEQSHGGGASSGSNWLTCEMLDDCASDDAVTCDEGYCRDAQGQRIAAGPHVDGSASSDAGRQDPPSDASNNASGDASGAGRCVWGVDAMLGQVDASAPGRLNCGRYNLNVATPRELDSALACFTEAAASGDAVELSLNACIDCSRPTVFVATGAGELFALLMEQDFFSAEQQAIAQVDRCAEITPVDVTGDVQSLSCAGAQQLYRCEEPLSAERTDPTAVPVTPRKIDDVPADGAEAVTLHLYVSNQSFDNDPVDIRVLLEDAPVVAGEFEVEGQHNWILFDIDVPAGTLALRVESLYGDAELEQDIDVPAERWLVVDYWYYAGEDGRPSFTATLHDMPVAFD